MEEEVLYARSNPELSVEEAAGRWAVSAAILKRYIIAAPNARDLARDFASPGPNWRLVEFFDLHDATPSWLTSEEYASMFCGVSSPFDWECHVVREFAIYAERNMAATSDNQLGMMATAACSAMRRMRTELHKKRQNSRPSNPLRKIQSRIAALACDPPTFNRECRLADMWGEIQTLIEWRDLSAAVDACFEDVSIAAHRARLEDPTSIMRILDEAIKRKTGEPRRPAMWEADALLREHFWELCGLAPRNALGEHRANYLDFTYQLCTLHDVPHFGDHIVRRRKK